MFAFDREGSMANDRHAIRKSDLTPYEEKCAEIRHKARTLFQKYGVKKTTVEDIANACNLSKAALYYYYKGKEEILAAVMRDESESLIAKMRAAAASAPDSRAELKAILKTRVCNVSELVSKMLDDAASGIYELYPSVSAVRDQHLAEEAKLIDRVLRDGNRRCVFREICSENTPMLMMAAILGIDLYVARRKKCQSLEASIDELLELIFNGLCVHD